MMDIALKDGVLRLTLALAIALIVVVALFILFEPLLPYHFLHGDERYYIGRALQDIEFYMGVRPAKAVWFSAGNHPFSAETIIGLSIVLQGEFRKAPGNPWKTKIDEGLLVAARRSALFVGLLGLCAILDVIDRTRFCSGTSALPIGVARLRRLFHEVYARYILR